MNKGPDFFVPAATPDMLESVYADFAKWCKRSVPPPGERIYSITFTHEGEEWTATVGEHLRGIRYKRSRVRGKEIERRIPLSDPAIVLAIFPGAPFMVVTNHRIVGNIGSHWDSPFYAGQPTSITRFATSSRHRTPSPDH